MQVHRSVFAAVVMFPLLATAQNPTKAAPKPAMTVPAAAVGTWDGKSMIGPKDSVVATSTMTIAADGKVTITFPNRPTVQGRVIAAGGDSVSAEFGPYESVVKAGLKVTTHTTSHFKGNAGTGTFDAKYSDGSTLKGKTTSMKKTAK